MQIDVAKAKELFIAVLDLTGPERSAYLDAACAGDPALRQRVGAMLQTHENTGELLSRPAAEMLADANATEGDGTAVFPSPAQTPATFVEGVQADAECLTFLTPTNKPGHLGRLGHYEVQEVIGKGGFGIVLKAFDEKLHRVVAIKVLSPAYAANGSARKRFIREAQTAAAVKNEHVVAIYSVQDEAQPPYLVMEMIDGVSLQDKLDKKGPLSLKEILRIGLQTAEGLAAAHRQGLVHRDIKPANILLENGVQRVKITDFGLARAVDDASITQSGTVAGTPMYMSPEQAEGLAVDHRSDLFSLGTVLYAMCTGHSPFRASGTHAVLKRVIDAAPRPIREINDEIPDWLADLIAKLHAKKPGDRIQSAKEVAELLGGHLADLQAGRAAPRVRPVEAPATMTAPAAVPSAPVAHAVGAPRPKRRRWVAALVVLAIMILLLPIVLIAIGTSYFVGRQQPRVEEERARTEAEIRRQAESVGIPPLAQAPDNDGWVQLFNGKDLTGWKMHPLNFSGWTVENGAIVGRGVKKHLFSERGDFQNFHLRADVKMNSAGDGGIVFGVPFEFEGKAGPGAYQAQLGLPMIPTGSLHRWSPWAKIHRASEKLHKADEWFRFEIIVQARHIQVLFNGRVVSDFHDMEQTPGRGHLMLYVFGLPNAVPLSEIRFRKIEIKELPPEEPHWVQLFNGTDLTGWKKRPGKAGNWQVINGMLVGSDAATFLLSERGNYQDFHLRIQAAVNTAGYGGVFFRVPESAFPAGDSIPLGFYAQINATRTDVNRTGSLFGNHVQPFAIVPTEATTPKANEWFDMEIIATGRMITVKINGQNSVEYIDTRGKQPAGHLALLCMDANTVVKFRKIEIKELSPPGSAAVVLLRKFEGYTEDVLGLAFSPDGSRALSSHNDGQVVHWDVATGTIVKRMDGKHEGGAESVAFAPDATWAISGGRTPDQSVRIWDLANGKEKCVIPGFPGPVSRLIVFRDGTRALAGASLCLINLKTRKIDKVFDTGKFDAIAIALSPDEKHALSGGSNKRISLWNVESGTKMTTFEPGHTGQIRSLAFSPDGKRGVSCSTDKTCRVWDVDTGKTLLVFAKHTTGVGEVVFLPDGRHVASIAWDNAVRIWDSQTGAEIYTIPLPAKGQALAAAPVGRTILAGCTRMSEAGAGAFNLGLWQLPALPTDPASNTGNRTLP